MQKSLLFPLFIVLSASPCFAQFATDCQSGRVVSTQVVCSCDNHVVQTAGCAGTDSPGGLGCSPTSISSNCGTNGTVTCSTFRAVTCDLSEGDPDVVKSKAKTLESLSVPKIVVPSLITPQVKQSACGSPEVFEAWLQKHLIWNYQAKADTPKTVAQK